MRERSGNLDVRTLLNSSADALWLVDRDGTLQAYNRTFALHLKRLYGVRAYRGLTLVECLPEELRSQWRELYRRALAGEAYALEESFRAGNRDWYYELIVRPVRDSRGEVVAVSVTAHNTTERYLSEVRTGRFATRLQALLDSAVRLNSSIREPEEVYHETMELLAASVRFDTATVQVLEGDSLTVKVSRGFPADSKVQDLRFPLDERFPNYYVVTERRSLAVADIRTAYPHFLTEDGKYESGHVRSWMGIPLIEEGQVVGMLTMDRITVDPFSSEDVQVGTVLAHNAAVAINNARLYRRLVTANTTQETLLRELHHRVKNNLQLVSSLMSLRSEGLGEDARTILASLRYRVLALSAVHESLYRSERLDRVDLVRYMKDVVGQVEAGYRSGETKISFTSEAPPSLDCTLERAIPFGLILSELILNAVKHAFRGRGSGSIHVSLSRDAGERVCLEVDDDGTGFEPGAEGDHEPASFGMTLVRSLTKQLEGDLVLEAGPDRGTSWRLRFEGKPPRLVDPESFG
jgi:PAS domain S-box-containing protein